MGNKIPTLLQLANIQSIKLKTQKAALILIDFQQEYVSGKLVLGNMGTQSIAAAKKTLDFARQHQMPIFHIIHIAPPNSAIFAAKSENIEIVRELKPMDGEYIIEKTLPSAFDNTTLNEQLVQLNITQILVAGFMSHMCVSTTVRAALPLQYDVILCEDACATRNLSLNGEVISAEQLHKATIAALQDRFATIIKSNNL